MFILVSVFYKPDFPSGNLEFATTLCLKACKTRFLVNVVLVLVWYATRTFSRRDTCFSGDAQARTRATRERNTWPYLHNLHVPSSPNPGCCGILHRKRALQACDPRLKMDLETRGLNTVRVASRSKPNLREDALFVLPVQPRSTFLAENTCVQLPTPRLLRNFAQQANWQARDPRRTTDFEH